MELLLICLVILCAFMILKIRNGLIAFKSEVSLLPMLETSVKSQDKFENKLTSLSEIVSVPKGFKGPGIVMVVSSTCPVCHEELEEFLNLNSSRKIPFFCTLIEDQTKDTKSFWDNYKENVDIVPISVETLNAMQISIYPTFLYIDNIGIIEQKSLLLSPLLKRFK